MEKEGEGAEEENQEGRGLKQGLEVWEVAGENTLCWKSNSPSFHASAFFLSVYLSVCVYVYLSVCLPVYLSVCLSFCLAICLSVCLSVCAIM